MANVSVVNDGQTVDAVEFALSIVENVFQMSIIGLATCSPLKV